MMTEITLPHEREILAIVDAAFVAYQSDDPNYLCLCITDHRDHASWLLGNLKRGVAWDVPSVKIFRDGVQVKGGGKVVIMSAGDPGRLMGVRPNRIILFGNLGEMYYWLHSMSPSVEAIA